MNKIIHCLLIISIVAIFAGCQKGLEGPSGGSAAAILTSGKWQLTSAMATVVYPGLGAQSLDLLSIQPTCINDNYGIFNADGSITVDEGATKCDPTSPQQKTEGTWAFSANNTKLTISDPLANSPLTVLAMDVLSISNDAMKLHLLINNGGATSETTYEYTHIK